MGLLRILNGQSCEGDVTKKKLHDWYKARGGDKGLIDFLRGLDAVALSRVADALNIQVAPSKKRKPDVFYRSSILEWFINLEKEMLRAANTRPCHWCSEPCSVWCTGCAKSTVHHFCMLDRMQGVPTDDGDRLCRGCAKKAFDKWALSKSSLHDLECLCAHLSLPSSTSRTAMVKSLRTKINFEKNTCSNNVRLSLSC